MSIFNKKIILQPIKWHRGMKKESESWFFIFVIFCFSLNADKKTIEKRWVDEPCTFSRGCRQSEIQCYFHLQGHKLYQTIIGSFYILYFNFRGNQGVKMINRHTVFKLCIIAGLTKTAQRMWLRRIFNWLRLKNLFGKNCNPLVKPTYLLR